MLVAALVREDIWVRCDSSGVGDAFASFELTFLFDKYDD